MTDRVEINGDALEDISGGAFDVKSDGKGGFKVRGQFTGQVFHLADYSKYMQFLAVCGNNPNTLEGENNIIDACKGKIFD